MSYAGLKVVDLIMSYGPSRKPTLLLWLEKLFLRSNIDIIIIKQKKLFQIRTKQGFFILLKDFFFLILTRGDARIFQNRSTGLGDAPEKATVYTFYDFQNVFRF